MSIFPDIFVSNPICSLEIHYKMWDNFSIKLYIWGLKSHMNTRKNWEDYDITDYHRLSYIGDNVNEILTILLKNLNAGVGLFEVGETIRA